MRSKIEQALLPDSHPLPQVPSVRNRARHADQTDWLLRLSGDKSHAGHTDLHVGGPERTCSTPVHLRGQQLQFVYDQDADLTDHPLPSPLTRHVIKFVGSADNDVALFEYPDVCRLVPCEHRDLQTQALAEFVLPLFEPLHGRPLVRGDVHGSVDVVVLEHPQDCERCTDGFPCVGRRTQKEVLVAVVGHREHLRLHWVEELGALVKALSKGEPEGTHGEGLEVKKLCGGGVLLRQDEGPEGDGKHRLRREPAVRDDPNEVIGGKRVKQGDCEDENVVGVAALLSESEQLMMQNMFSITVLDEDPERLRGPMNLLIPMEVRGDRQLDVEG
mmetsp:Transcript_28320/g.55450  ORF Transcript_28320/g.55450 Transcript_28320/m.55450 type:complete len:330 (-) Transcript_28320:843-1832(-)